MHQDLLRLQKDVTSALSDLDRRQTQATPASQPDKWSIQQIVEHLIFTYRGSVPAIQARIDKRSGTRAKPTWRQHLAQWTYIGLGHAPFGRVAPASVSPSRPLTVRSGADLTERITAELVRVDDVTVAGERIFGERRAVSHLAFGPLSMQQWRRFHLVHGLHHLRQIRAIRRDHAF